MSAPERHEAFVAEALRAGLRLPAAAAVEAYAKTSRYRRFFRAGSAVPAMEEATESGQALRVFRADGRVGHAHAAGPDLMASLEPTLQAANRLADRCSPGTSPLPPGKRSVPDLDLVDPAAGSSDAVAGWMSRLEQAAVEEGGGEIAVESFLCIAGVSDITLGTSAGFLGSYRSSLITAVLCLRASRGDEASLDRSVIAARHLASLDADRIGRNAVRRARLPLAGGRLPPGPVRVALEPRVACMLLEHLVPSLQEGALRQGRSALPRGEPGTRIGSASLTLVDDASMPRGLASASFDGEGRDTRPWTLVDAGQLVAPLDAPALRSRRVGSAQRPSYTDPPVRLPANLHLARGARGPRSILADAGRVLRVTGATLLGRGGPASGEVVLDVSGERLESGEPVGGVRGVTLSATLQDLLHGVLEVGNDIGFHLRGTSFGSPTLLLDGFTIV